MTADVDAGMSWRRFTVLAGRCSGWRTWRRTKPLEGAAAEAWFQTLV